MVRGAGGGPPPLHPAAGGRLREFWWHNGATLQCRSKRAHAEDGGGTCVQLEQEQQLLLLGCFRTKRLASQRVLEMQQENLLRLNETEAT